MYTHKGVPVSSSASVNENECLFEWLSCRLVAYRCTYFIINFVSFCYAGICPKMQRRIVKAIKRSRKMGQFISRLPVPPNDLPI